jgi:TctA family transporter
MTEFVSFMLSPIRFTFDTLQNASLIEWALILITIFAISTTMKTLSEHHDKIHGAT